MLCKNESCPSREACYRFTAKPSDHQVYAKFSVSPGEDRCEYFIPNKMEEGKRLLQAEKLLHELIDAVDDEMDWHSMKGDELRYKVNSFLFRRKSALDTAGAV